jgi:hypothetical protein
MKNVSNAPIHNSKNHRDDDSFPFLDPVEWVYEHHLLANFAHSLTSLTSLFPDITASPNSFVEAEEEDVAINSYAMNLLRDRYSEDHWRYVDYLFS